MPLLFFVLRAHFHAMSVLGFLILLLAPASPLRHSSFNRMANCMMCRIIFCHQPACSMVYLPEMAEDTKSDETTEMAVEKSPQNLALTLQLPKSPTPLSRPMTPRSPVIRSVIGWRPVAPGYTAPVVISRTIQVGYIPTFIACLFI